MAEHPEGFFTGVVNRTFRENQPTGERAAAVKRARLKGGDSPTKSPSQQQAPQLLYVIRSRDTLAKIARRNGSDAATLFELNRQLIGPDPNELPVGVEIRIPNQ